MLVHELSKLTGTNIETIRMYRKKGLLKPVKDPENGYYEYSNADAFVLMQLQLLRLENISLAEIHQMFYAGNSLELQSRLDKQISEILSEIHDLEEKLNILLINKAHLSDTPTDNSVKALQINDDKYDYYLPPQVTDMKKLCAASLIPYSIVLSLDATLLNNSSPPVGPLPIRCGIGCYRADFQRGGVDAPPPNAAKVPAGKYLATTISLRRLEELDGQQLTSMYLYAQEHRLQFTGATTAYITQIDYNGKTPIFYFRLRAQVVDRT